MVMSARSVVQTTAPVSLVMLAYLLPKLSHTVYSRCPNAILARALVSSHSATYGSTNSTGFAPSHAACARWASTCATNDLPLPVGALNTKLGVAEDSCCTAVKMASFCQSCSAARPCALQTARAAQ